MGFITNQKDIVKSARNSYINYPTIVNNVPQDKKTYNNSIDSFTTVDNNLSHSQMAIGTSSNVAQIAQTYSYNFDDKKYQDYVCILSVVA